MMFLDMSTHTKNVITFFAIFWCCVVPRFECCDPGKRMTMEEKVGASNIVLLGSVLTHYAETRTNMFTAEIQVKCVLKDCCGISVHNVVNVTHAGNDSGGHCFDTTLTINNTYYIFFRVLTDTIWTPATDEIPEASSDVTQLLTTCGLSASGPGPANVCDGLKSKPCPTTTPRPISSRRPKQSTASSKTTRVVELTSSSTSGKKGTTATVVGLTSSSTSGKKGTTATVVGLTSSSTSGKKGTTATVVGLTSSSTSGKKGTTATVVGLTSSSTSGKKDVKEKSMDNKVGAILGGVLGPLAAGGVAATIYFYVKTMKNKKVSDTEPQKDKILEDEYLSEIPMSKPPMATGAIEKL